ncbi:MAG: PLP-dependent cysteine synthase family protein [Phycisphaerae bacterium]|jgi:cysteine synthase A|nr:PLP-dependent cysteine synthase family protein [Phycisphaerae bacterium]
MKSPVTRRPLGDDNPADALQPMVGRTPLLEIHYESRGRPRTLYAKYEQKNMTGSVKDRMALWIIREAYERGDLRPGDTIAEATSGNTGISFAAIGRALGHPVRIYMPDWMSRERVALIMSFGADVIPVSREEGGFRASIALADAYAREHPAVFLPHQFDNPANVTAHERTTGPELIAQIESLGRAVDAFVAGVGTGGTVMGVGRALRARWSASKIHPLEPANSPTLRAGNKVGSHRIQGISDEFVPSIVRLDQLDPVIDVWDGDAILMAQALGQVGLAVGISSGANFLGADLLLDEHGDGATVATLFADSNKKYLSTDLYRPEPIRDGYATPHIRILSWRAIGCEPCCGRASC